MVKQGCGGIKFQGNDIVNEISGHI